MRSALQPAPAVPPLRTRQQALWCPCCAAEGGRLVGGYCRRCYARRRRDRAYFAGLRERVLRRDGYGCQGCGARGDGNRTLPVHHRRPGLSHPQWLITLCPRCHARIHRLLVVRRPLPLLLLELWRELHPRAQEQFFLEFSPQPRPEPRGLAP